MSFNNSFQLFKFNILFKDKLINLVLIVCYELRAKRDKWKTAIRKSIILQKKKKNVKCKKTLKMSKFN